MRISLQKYHRRNTENDTRPRSDVLVEGDSGDARPCVSTCKFSKNAMFETITKMHYVSISHSTIYKKYPDCSKYAERRRYCVGMFGIKNDARPCAATCKFSKNAMFETITKMHYVSILHSTIYKKYPDCSKYAERRRYCVGMFGRRLYP